MLSLPRLYPILDRSCFADSQSLFAAARELAEGGCTLMQYRNKSRRARQMLDEALELRASLNVSINLIMNDRADLCLAARYIGLHVGQDDLSVESARSIIGAGHWLGVSTHNQEQLADAGETSADYLAIGPVFETGSKANPDPTVGLEGVRRARELTRKPLVAIGGITRANARSVINAGADSVAVISDLLRDPGKSAEEFFKILR
jgi:thiamine-phosphate pyrophosphorylase